MNYVNEWESKGCDPDICIYGTFCNPCLFDYKCDSSNAIAMSGAKIDGARSCD